MIGWHLISSHLNGHEFEQALGDSEGQESLVCRNAWGHRVGHKLVTEQQQQSTIGAQHCSHSVEEKASAG